MWSVTVAHAHLMEDALRVYGATTSHSNNFEKTVLSRALTLATTKTETCSNELYDLWSNWKNQHPDWQEGHTLYVPGYFLIMLQRRDTDFQHLIQQSLPLPMFRSWIGLKTAVAVSDDAARLDLFLDEAGKALWRTVHRNLERSKGGGKPFGRCGQRGAQGSSGIRAQGANEDRGPASQRRFSYDTLGTDNHDSRHSSSGGTGNEVH